MSLWYCPKCDGLRGPSHPTGICPVCGGGMNIATVHRQHVGIPSSSDARLTSVAQGTAIGSATNNLRDLQTKLAAAEARADTAEAQLRAQGWQPIETAPENTSLLIFIPNAEHYGPGIYRAILVNMGTGKHWLTTGWHIGRSILSSGESPTHWMPLPNEPITQESQP